MWLQWHGQRSCWSSAFLAGLVWAVCTAGVESAKCYKDDSVGDRVGNVYHCNSDGLPKCCHEEGQPTCCKDETEKNVEEQLQLWGTVAAMIIVIGLLFVCCKNDISFCSSETSLKERWRNYRAKQSENPAAKEEDLKKESPFGSRHYYDNPIGGFEKGEGHGIVPSHSQSQYSGTPLDSRRSSYHKFDSVFA